MARRRKLPYDGKKAGHPTREEDMGIQILAVALGILAAIWIIVLWGSQYFGSR